MNTLSFKTTLTLALIALSSETTTHTSSFAEKMASARQCITPIIHYGENVFFDLSAIKKHSELSKKIMAKFKNGTIPLVVAKYTLPNGKELWFFLDRHDNPQSKYSNFAKNLIFNENFTHGIIEIEITSTALLHSDPSLTFNGICDYIQSNFHFFENDTISMICALLNKQKKITLPGDFSTPQEAIKAYKQEGLSPDQILYKLSSIINRKLSTETVFSFFEKEDLSFKCVEKEDHRAIHDKYSFTRDKKIAQTIIETLHDKKAEKVLTIYGAGHYFTLAPLLEEHFGNPEFIAPEQYAEILALRS